MSRRTTDAPWITPSATRTASAACAAFDTPTPTSTGRSVTALSRCGHARRALAARLARSPVTPSSPTAYTKPRDRAQTRGSRSSGAVGAASMTVSTPAASAASHHGPDSSSGRSGSDGAALTPASRAALGEALVAGPEHEVVVRHHRRPGRPRRGRPARRGSPSGVAPGSSARCEAAWMTGPSMTGSEKGMPTSMASAPAAAAARTASAQPGQPAGDVGHEQLAAGGPPLPQRLLELAALVRCGGDHWSPSMSIIWATSLSPRPDRLTSTVGPASAGAAPHHPGDGVGRLEGRDDALGARQQLERVEHLGVGDRLVAGPADRREVGVLGPDARVVEPGRDRVGLQHLAVLVLQQEALHAVHHARHARGRPPRRPPARPRPARASVSTKPAKMPAGVGPAADAGHDHVGIGAEEGPALLAGLVADHPLELAHHPRVRMRAHHRAEAVVGGLDGGHPVPHGLVDRVLQGAAAAVRPARPRRRAGACGTR